jgi:deoxyribonuclease-4
MEDSPHTVALAYDSEDEYRPEPEPEAPPAAWCDGSVRIGIHTSIAGDIVNSLESAKKLGCNALQIFSASPRMWPQAGSRLDSTSAERFRSRRTELGLGPLVIHANYLINLASHDAVTRARSMQTLHTELVRAAALGADFLVLHPGSAGGGDRAQAIQAVAQGLRQAARGIRFHVGEFHDFSRGGLRILLENTSGMGDALGTRMEELAEIMRLAPDLPLGTCIDTAHAFEAGYAIHTAEGLEEFVAALERTVTLRRLGVLHVNDSKTPFGSRVDRHENIGQGKIGREAFQRILRHPRLAAAVGGNGLPGRAFILETPIDAPGDDRRNVRALWELAGVPVKQAPAAVKGFSMVRASRKPADAVVPAAAPVASGRAGASGKAKRGKAKRKNVRK